jgi:hypothetical protein
VDSCHATYVFCRQQPARRWTGDRASTLHVFLRVVHADEFILKAFGSPTQLRELDCRVEVSHGKFRLEEELEVSLWTLSGGFEDFMCVVVQCYWEYVIK